MSGATYGCANKEWMASRPKRRNHPAKSPQPRGRHHKDVCQESTLMTEIFRNRDSATMGHLQSLLEAEGIRTYLRDEDAANTSFPEITPALCIIEDADVEGGVELIRAYIESSNSSPTVSHPQNQEHTQ
jgi:hypothetical protein